MAPILEVDGAVKRFGGVAAVNGVSLALEPGRIYGLIGPNGSGKTTLFNCITGVDHLDEGRIRFKGVPIDRLKPHRIFHLGVGRTFQVIRVFPELTALENLLVVTTTGYAEARARARELLARVKLDRLADEFAGNLSYGQQKLVEFVRVLMTDPELIQLVEQGPAPARPGQDRTAGRARHEGGDGPLRDGVRAGPRREAGRGGAGRHPGRRAGH